MKFQRCILHKYALVAVLSSTLSSETLAVELENSTSLTLAPIANPVVQEVYPLRQNPFLRAFKKARRPAAPQASNDSTGDMELRAILYDDTYPLVNVGGTVIAIGESYAGFKLQEVTPRAAVFTRDGRETRLEMQSEEYADSGE